MQVVSLPAALPQQFSSDAENDTAGLPGHQLMLIIARAVDTLDTLPLQVSPDVAELLSRSFDEKWQQGELSKLWSEEDERRLLRLLAPYLEK